ncbi:MAG: prepilin-type N-terminal cleavage/methylation domain-containing protein [Candidatus Staskawiczbacteria bacterium]|nr:prepilin-type N-terminal cleavage/methylation domain-containing protein [Candidatus Staskawiczbacteria bacterium]
MMFYNTKNKGFTLIELVISIAILIVAVIGVYNSFSTVVILTSSVSSRFTAAYLAQEGVEITRNMRDNNWLQKEQGREWNYGLLNCENGCEADYKTGTSVSANSGLIPLGDNYLKIKNDITDPAKKVFYSYDSFGSFTATKFKRKITITPDPNPLRPVLKVSVLVTWMEKEEPFSITVEEYLYDWY